MKELLPQMAPTVFLSAAQMVTTETYRPQPGVSQFSPAQKFHLSHFCKGTPNLVRDEA